MDPVEIIIFLTVGLAAATSGALMGVGGGFLMVPVFIFMGYNIQHAPALSLFVIIFVALSATLKYYKEKTINYHLGLIYAPFSVVGAYLGVELLQLVDELIFKIIFSILFIIIGIRLVLKKGDQPENMSDDQTDNQRWSYYWVILWGFVTGLSASFVGIGGGLIAVPVIYLFFRERMHVAISTSLFIMIFTASFSTLWNYIKPNVTLDVMFFTVGLVVAAGAVIGSQIGSRIQTRLKGKTLQIIFGIFMSGVAIPLLWLGP